MPVSAPLQSLLDDFGLADVSSAADDVKRAVEQQQFEKATELWSVAETVVEQVGGTTETLIQSTEIMCNLIVVFTRGKKLNVVFLLFLMSEHKWSQLLQHPDSGAR